MTSASPVESFEAVELVDQDLVDAAEVARLLLVGEYLELLGPLGQQTGLSLALVDPGLDLLAGSEQAPQEGVLLDDLGVVLGVAGRFGASAASWETVVLASGILDLAVLVQCLSITLSSSTRF